MALHHQRQSRGCVITTPFSPSPSAGGGPYATSGPGGWVNNFVCNTGFGSAFGIECQQNNSGPLGGLGIGSSATGNSTPNLIQQVESWFSTQAAGAEALGFRVSFGVIGVIVIAIGLAAIVFNRAGGSAPASA